jgi:hypothetical protein
MHEGVRAENWIHTSALIAHIACMLSGKEQNLSDYMPPDLRGER